MHVNCDVFVIIHDDDSINDSFIVIVMNMTKYDTAQSAPITQRDCHTVSVGVTQWVSHCSASDYRLVLVVVAVALLDTRLVLVLNNVNSNTLLVIVLLVLLILY